jgi:hypothetical protein
LGSGKLPALRDIELAQIEGKEEAGAFLAIAEAALERTSSFPSSKTPRRIAEFFL